MISNFIRMCTSIAVLLALVVLPGCDSDSSTLATSQASNQATGVGDQSNGADGADNNGSDSGGDDTTGDDTTGDSGGDDGNSTNGDSGGDGGDATGGIDDEYEAVYRATFNATWSADTHPTNFPANPHFSPLTGAVHSAQSVFWERGQLASDGIEEMAETGATAMLLAEIQSVIDEGRAWSSIEGGGIALSPGSVSVDFTINRDNPFVTLVSMLAPSPDWFIGINSQNLIDQNGDFVQSLTLDLNLYDSGTDGGARFNSADEEIPRSPIDLVNSFPMDSDFLDGQPSVGRLLIQKIQ